MRGCNGGRARCPHRAARVMRVGNGGAIMTSRRVRGPVAHRAAGGEPPLASRGMQNSQRVLLAKPRTAPRRGGASGEPPRAMGRHRALPQRDRTTGHGRCARRRGRNAPWVMRGRKTRDAKARTAPMARRRDGDIAPYRNGTASRRTNTGHEGVRTASAHGRWARVGGTGAGHEGGTGILEGC